MINTIFDFWIVFTVICSIIAGILLFPDFSCLPLIESRTKKLTENIDNNQ